MTISAMFAPSLALDWNRAWLIPASTNAWFPVKIFKDVALPGIYTVTASTNITVRYNGVVLTPGGETVSFPQSQSQETLEVQVAAPGSATLAVTFTGTGLATNCICSTYVNIKAWGVEFGVDADYDGDIDVQDDLLEETKGGLVGVGASMFTPVDIAVVVPEGISSMSLTLSAVSGGDKIKIWTGSTTNSTMITLPKTWSAGETIPSRIWAQGLAHSDTSCDVSLRLTGSLQGVTSVDTVNLTVVQVEFAEDPNQNYGFDSSGPWVSIATSGVTTVKVMIAPIEMISHILFKSSNLEKIEISSVQELTGEGKLLTLMADAVAGDSEYIQAAIEGTIDNEVARIKIAIYPLKSIFCFFHAVNGWTGTIPVTAVNSIFRQSVLRVSNPQADQVTCSLALGNLSDVDMEFEEDLVVANTIQLIYENDVFIIPHPGKIRLSDGTLRFGVHFNPTSRHISIVSADAPSFERYIAHEICHRWIEDHAENGDCLMNAEPGFRLRKVDWDLIHQ